MSDAVMSPDAFRRAGREMEDWIADYTKRAEEEFLQFAVETEANDEFDALIGIAGKEEEGGESASPEQTKIPEG